MNNQTKTIIAWTLIIAVIIVGGSYYWGSSTIIADSSPPIILESVTTGGDLAYGTGNPKVTLVFTENVGVQSATATLYNVGSLGLLGSKIEEITLTQTAKTGTQYQYDGRFTKTLEI